MSAGKPIIRIVEMQEDDPQQAALAATLDAFNWCTIERQPAMADDIDDAQSAAACIAVVAGQVAAIAAGTVASLAARHPHTPVVVICPGIAELESDYIGRGAEDCLDPNNMPAGAMSRALKRCVDRAAQRSIVRSAQRQYHDLFDHMPIAACRVDVDGHMTMANRAFLDFMQARSSDEVSDANLNGLLAGLGSLQRACADDVPDYNDNHILDLVGGEQRHVIVFARANTTPDGERFMEVYLTDVTEHEMQTRRVIAAENRLRELYDNVPVMMFAIDTDFKVLQPNRALTSVLRNDQLERGTVSIFSLLHDDTPREVATESINVIRSGERDTDRPMSIKRHDGSAMECLYSATPKFDRLGNVVGAHAMLVDVTAQNEAQRERDQLQEQLQLTQKLESIGELAAGIAHEINTPAQYVSDNLSFLSESFDDLKRLLTALPGALDELQHSESAAAVVQRLRKAIDAADLDYLLEEVPVALEQGQHGIGKIREIVLALKDFSHPGSGNMEPADLNRIIESTVTVARNEWKYIADLTFDLDESLPPVQCFPSALAQVVLNIVVNAAHAIGDARPDDSTALGAIRIASRLKDAETVMITIEDNGPGMPEAVRRKIFDPFFTTKEVGRGTGQGLAISRSVVTEQHGGTLTVETELGKGSVFTIELPLSGRKAEDWEEEAA